MTEELPHLQALKRFNDFSSSIWKDTGKPVIELILEHNSLLQEIESLPQAERESHVGTIASKFGEMIITYLRLSDEYVMLVLEYDANSAPVRPKPTDIEKKYFPIAEDEYKYWDGKDKGSVQL